MKIVIETIPHQDQRYDTAGDWFVTRKDGLTIRVSRLGDWRFEMLVAVHELIEVLLCRYDGVTQDAVDKFDFAYEKARKPGDESEPGDDPRAPYARQHCIATGFERILAALFQVSWDDYAEAIERLPEWKPKK